MFLQICVTNTDSGVFEWIGGDVIFASHPRTYIFIDFANKINQSV